MNKIIIRVEFTAYDKPCIEFIESFSDLDTCFDIEEIIQEAKKFTRNICRTSIVNKIQINEVTNTQTIYKK